jgi:raffinose/stachyose/melibiose transport system substrate-binding protein
VRGFRLRFLAALSLVVLAVGVAPTTGGHAATVRVHPRAPITLTYWWWAESDVPGADKWMRQTIALFQQAHPSIRIKLDIQATDSLISNFQAAAQAHKGPDLATQWATIPVLSQAWAGAIAPVSDYVPRNEIAQWVNTSENLYAGKLWAMPLYLIGIPVVYNKTLFRKAGLNPDRPPHTWAQFLAACARLKARGIIPFALGNKDGYSGAWFWSTFGKGTLNSADDVKRAVVGQTHFTDPQFTAWLSALQTMVKSGYVNNDVASLDLNNGFTPFVRGKAAMTLSTDANILSYARTLGAKNIGLFLPPPIGSGKLASYYDVTQSSSEMITAWSGHKREAALFLKFMHTPERLKALYDQTGAFPADKRFNLQVIKDPLQKQMLKWDLGLRSIWLENLVPTQVDLNGDQTAGETITSRSGTPEMAAQLWERTARQWRASNPDGVKRFKAWIGSSS